MELKIASEENTDLWDSLVERSPHGTIFHTWKFLKIVEKHTPSRFYPMIGMKGTTPIGVYPLFLQKKFFLKMVFSPPPHVAVPYLGPVLVDYDKLKQSKKESVFIEFQKHVDEFISSKLSADYIHISVSPAIMDCRPFKWTNYKIKPRYSYSIEFHNSLEQVWGNMNKKRKNEINRAKREGVLIEEGSKKEMIKLYELLNDRYEEQSRSVSVSKDYLLDIYKAFYPENLKILIARYNGDIITGTVDAVYRDTTYFWIGNPKPSVKIANANELLTWKSMKQAFEGGCKYYEIIGIATTERLYKHYSKLNPNFSAYFSATKCNHLSKILESGYTNILKPLSSKLS